MNYEKTVAFLKLLGSEIATNQVRAEWVVASCPLAKWKHDNGVNRSKTFAVKREHGDAFCNCFSCNYHGKLSDLIVDMQTLNKNDPQVKVNWLDALKIIEDDLEENPIDLDFPDFEETIMSNANSIHVYPEWWLGSFNQWYEVKDVANYILDRGFEPEHISAHDIHADSTQRRVCFPVRDFMGRLVGLHGRAIDKDVDPRYRMYLQAGRNNPQIWYGEHWLDSDKPLLIVEGPFDVLSVRRVYHNVASPLFANPNEAKIRRMSDFYEQFTLFDHGKGGNAGREKYTKAIGGSHALTHLLPPEGKDPGECSVQELVDALSPYLPLDV